MIFRWIQGLLLLLTGLVVLYTETRARIFTGGSTWRLPDPRDLTIFLTDVFFWIGVSLWAFSGVVWFFYPGIHELLGPVSERPLVSLQVVGAVLGVLGWLLIAAGIFALGHSFRTSIDFEEKIELKTDGIYRISRNPMAAGLILQGWAALFMQQNGVTLAAALLLHICNRLRVHFEEAHLSDTLGGQYLDYLERTPRFFGLSRRR